MVGVRFPYPLLKHIHEYAPRNRHFEWGLTGFREIVSLVVSGSSFRFVILHLQKEVSMRWTRFTVRKMQGVATARSLAGSVMGFHR